MQLSNEIGNVILARKPPTFQVQNSVPPEIYRWLDGLERGGYEDEGMSRETGSGALPPGVDSAPAQREWNFKEGQKFAPVSQRWEDAVAVDPAIKMIDMYRHHLETNKARPRVSWASRRRMFTVKFPDLRKDAYVIRPEASSLDSLSPAARVQSALELAQTGWVSPSEGRALVAHPDLKEADDLDNASETYARWVLTGLRKGRIIPIDEKADLGVLDRVVRQGRVLAITQDAPQDIVDGMSRFLEEMDSVKQTMMAAMAPPPGAVPGPSGSAPPPSALASGLAPQAPFAGT
jgi:hypothetical protein